MDDLSRSGRLTIELSNSSRRFWQHLNSKAITEASYRDNPAEVGAALIELVERWHQQISVDKGGRVDLSRSSYLVLSWNSKGVYQLHQLALNLPNPESLKWRFPTPNRLVGENAKGKVFEWYGGSGGQLKYFPLAESALWRSAPFNLEPLTLEDEQRGVAAKAAAYFPELWLAASKPDAL